MHTTTFDVVDIADSRGIIIPGEQQTGVVGTLDRSLSPSTASNNTTDKFTLIYIAAETVACTDLLLQVP